MTYRIRIPHFLAWVFGVTIALAIVNEAANRAFQVDFGAAVSSIVPLTCGAWVEGKTFTQTEGRVCSPREAWRFSFQLTSLYFALLVIISGAVVMFFYGMFSALWHAPLAFVTIAGGLLASFLVSLIAVGHVFRQGAKNQYKSLVLNGKLQPVEDVFR